MKDDTFGNLLALVIVLGFFAIVGIMLFHEIPEASKDMLGPLIGGVIGAGVSTVIQYRWGSSAGSAAKSETLAKMTGTGDGGTVTTTGTVRTETRTESVTPPSVTDSDKGVING